MGNTIRPLKGLPFFYSYDNVLVSQPYPFGTHTRAPEPPKSEPRKVDLSDLDQQMERETPVPRSGQYIELDGRRGFIRYVDRDLDSVICGWNDDPTDDEVFSLDEFTDNYDTSGRRTKWILS